MNKITALAVTGLALAVVLPMSCSSKTCTEIGCYSGATVTVTGAVAAWDSMLPMKLDVCAAGCKPFRVDREAGVGGTICLPAYSTDQFGTWRCSIAAGNVVLTVPVRGSGSQSISLVATNDANSELFRRMGSVEVAAFYPNGYDCDKDFPCFQGKTELQP